MRRQGLSRRSEDAIDVDGEFLAFVLTGAAFLLIGLAIPLDTLASAAIPIAWGVVAVLVGRAIVIYGLLGGVARLERTAGLAPPLPLSWLHVMNWTACVAQWQPCWPCPSLRIFPIAGCCMGAVFGIVLFTLIVQGTTAERVVRWAGVDGLSERSSAATRPTKSDGR